MDARYEEEDRERQTGRESRTEITREDEEGMDEEFDMKVLEEERKRERKEEVRRRWLKHPLCKKRGQTDNLIYI